ncbi:c-type cytochrome [Hyphomicrobium sp.]|uniref:c-type cytochrome n=1 Tax=Hyphomicrobium sp. TaxID=82 RepID=UPI003D12E133
MAKFLITRQRADVTQVRAAVDEWIRFVNPGGYSGDACFTRGGWRNLYPKAPDMRKAETQSLSDGELFYIIHNGIRLTGMPAWGGADPDADEDSWKLAHFIRHLPQLTADDLVAMKRLNPKGPHELEEEEEIDEFLRGEGKSAPSHQH